MITVIVAFGTMWFWVSLTVAFLIVMLALQESENEFDEDPIFPGFLLLVSFLLFQFFTDSDPVGWVFNNPMTFVYGAIAYFCIGVVCSFGAWYFFLLRVRDRYKDFIAKHPNERPSSGVLGTRSYPPSYREFTGRIVCWIAYWPFSSLAKLIKDPIWRVALFLYHLFGRTYDAIAASVFKE